MKRSKLLAAGVAWAVLVCGGGVAAAVTGVGDDEDRLTPYVEAVAAELVDVAIPGTDGRVEEPVRCLVRVILEDVGLPAIEATGLSPEELARSQGLVDSGLLPNGPDVDVAERGIASCRFDRYTAELAVGQMSEFVAEDGPALDADATACIVDGMVGDSRFVPGLAADMVADPDPDAVDPTEVLVRALAGCPSVFVDFLAAVVEESSDLELSDEVWACLQEAVAADPDAFAAAMLRRDRDGVVDEAIDGCLAGLAGLPAD